MGEFGGRSVQRPQEVSPRLIRGGEESLGEDNGKVTEKFKQNLGADEWRSLPNQCLAIT